MECEFENFGMMLLAAYVLFMGILAWIYLPRKKKRQ